MCMMNQSDGRVNLYRNWHSLVKVTIAACKRPRENLDRDLERQYYPLHGYTQKEYRSRMVPAFNRGRVRDHVVSCGERAAWLRDHAGSRNTHQRCCGPEARLALSSAQPAAGKRSRRGTR